MIRPLALAVVAGLALPGAALGATITVTTTADTLAADGLCSLREAVIAANAGVPGGGCTPGAGAAADVIVLGPGVHRLSTAGRGEDLAATGDLDVRSVVTIRGAGTEATTIDAAGLDRALDVAAGGDLRVEALTVTGGAPEAGARGGGIRAVGPLAVVGARVSANATAAGRPGPADQASPPPLPGQSGAGVTAGSGEDGGDGGGIAASGDLLIVRSVISGNRTGDGGVGGAGTGGSGNASSGGVGAGGDAGRGSGGGGGAGGAGGGVWHGSGGALTVAGSWFADNRTGSGGRGGSGTPGSAGGGGPPGAGADGIGGTGGAGGDGGGLATRTAASIVASTFTGDITGAGGIGGSGDRVPPPPGGTSLGSAVGGDGGRGGDGGGIAIATGSAETTGLVLANVTLSGDLTGGGGGAGRVLALPATAGTAGVGGRGGGLSSVGGTLSIEHATVAGDGAGASGTVASVLTAADGATGATGAPGSGATASVSSNSVDSIVRTVFASGACSTTGFPLSDPLNIAFQAPSCVGAALDPRLAAPADNGGPVPTMRLQAGSAAIDRIGAAAGCAATDARGAVRPFGGGCDVGAYEVAPPAATTGAASAVTGSSALIAGTIETRGVPTPFRVEFGPTAAYGGLSAAGAAAGGAAPAPVTATLRGLAPLTTYHYRVVALGADGTSAGADRTFATGAAGPAGGGGPRITGLVVRPRRFAVVPRGGRLRAARRGRPALGAVVRFRLEPSARVTLVVDRPSRGRRVTLRSGRRGCVAAPAARAVARAARCTLHPSVGTLRRRGAAGADAVTLTGRFGGRALDPGAYRLTVTARTPSGRRSAPARTTFTVLTR